VQKLSNKDFKWTPDLAYVVGLITTDGNLSKDNRHITMTSSDIEQIKTFKKCLNLSNKIGNTSPSRWSKKPCYRIQFGNIQFYQWLLKIGLSPAKSHIIGVIEIPDKYFRDFLRGHLDGDGSVYTYIDTYNTFKNPKYIYNRLYVKFNSISKIHIEWLKQKIEKISQIKGNLLKPSNNQVVWTLRFPKKKSIKLLSWIYYDPNIPCLSRKKEIAKNFIDT